MGTTRLQLEHKGDDRHHYTNFANIIVSFGFVVIPVIGWLLDHKGYGITLGTINCIGVICSVLQAIPSLRLQVRGPVHVQGHPKTVPGQCMCVHALYDTCCVKLQAHGKVLYKLLPGCGTYACCREAVQLRVELVL